ncbi:MAG: hypothetical protein GDYSWBUE_001589 [Candidatus Fervidibacterota bacterium]
MHCDICPPHDASRRVHFPSHRFKEGDSSMGELVDRAAVNEFLLKALAAVLIGIALEAIGLLLGKLIERMLKGSLGYREARDKQWYVIRRRRLLLLPQWFIRCSLMLLAIFIALEIFDLPILPFTAWLAVTSLTAVLALRRLIENAIACYILMLEDVIGVGDRVRMGNCWATVEHIGWFVTKLRDDDGLTHTVMNSFLVQLMRAADGAHGKGNTAMR